ncbi:hypothetical protein [Geitlerinema calcuttense]|uniref:Uncharacterized protein n=1 Tax=Geitlerinema calcuttense NRMC-F 0142 TaxID=2922238 RepID=A0ABT7LVS9_9CYAN|nr:hypothetical protein [Geitlerinema calcuttense]MDL5056143.1 hypothetical protein [Geitlerinema calcuttense NRMC-F 0142]
MLDSSFILPLFAIAIAKSIEDKSPRCPIAIAGDVGMRIADHPSVFTDY